MEVYGVKPKKFTKAWWEYFWDYYKIHVLCVAFAAVLIGVTAVQCATRPSYDLQIDFASQFGVLPEYEQNIADLASKVIADADGDEKVEPYVLTFDLRDGGVVVAEHSMAMNTKFAIEQAYPEAYVFIVSEKYAKVSEDNGIMEDSSVWAEEIENEGGMVSLAGSAALSEIGIDAGASELFVGVVALTEEKKQDETECRRYENGVRFARYLLGLE